MTAGVKPQHTVLTFSSDSNEDVFTQSLRQLIVPDGTDGNNNLVVPRVYTQDD